MQYELSQRFYFEAAHTLQRQVDVEPSRRFHGHTYLAEVGITGKPDDSTGMVVDLSHLRRAVELVRCRLDHRLLDDVPGLGPATLENLCAFIAKEMRKAGFFDLSYVVVRREASGDACRLNIQRGP